MEVGELLHKNMNDETINKIMSTLPEPVRKLISDGVWEERAKEVCKKYSLEDSKTESLLNNVLLVLIGVDKPEDFLNNIIGDLGISRLLAEQIQEDLENRVFDYALKQVENEKPEAKQENVARKMELPKNNLEIRPQILPTEPKSAFVNNILDKQKPEATPFGAQNTLIKEANQKYTPGVVEKKLNSVTSSTLSSNNSPLKYEKDPYREPLA